MWDLAHFLHIIANFTWGLVGFYMNFTNFLTKLRRSVLFRLTCLPGRNFSQIIDIVSVCEYNNSTRQATACVCRSAEVRECAGKHCLMELSGGVV